MFRYVEDVAVDRTVDFDVFAPLDVVERVTSPFF